MGGNSSPEDRLSIVFSSPSELYIGGNLVGNMGDRTSQILQVLSEDPLLDIQIIPAVQNTKQGNRRRIESRQRLEWFSVSVIIYGPDSLAKDVGQFCQTCDLYLQDPVGCDRNVLYRNPHRFSLPEEALRLTFDIHEHNLGTTVTRLHNSNVHDSLITSRSCFELETPFNLKTPLMPLVSLSFGVHDILTLT